MKKYTIVGLFLNDKIGKKVSEELENAGFKNADYIVYLSEKNEEKVNFWKKFIFNETASNPENDGQIISVFIKNEVELAAAKNILTNNGAINTYELEDISPEDALSLQLIRNTVNVRVKSEVYTAIPQIKRFHEKHEEMVTN